MTNYSFNVTLKNGNIFSLKNGSYARINEKQLFDKFDMTVIHATVMKNSIIMITYDNDLQLPVINQYKESRKSNLFAFDFNGNLLWTVEDIINENIHFPFCGGYIATDKNIELFKNWYSIKFTDGHEYFIAYNNADTNYVIDTTDNAVVAIKTFRQ